MSPVPVCQCFRVTRLRADGAGGAQEKGPGVAARAFMLPMPARYGVQVAFTETPEKVL
ncbi:hypothetical protein SAMN02800692_2547 [Luteibacter sp. UNC138MFCol5.1]|nr:hypothetical protein SAMN02800692_2547 [Luteibacter sp. UNC138MFCol5.1]